MFLKLMYITNSLPIALVAEKYGVDRVWIDLETLGKEERQKGRDSVKSHHRISDITAIKPYLTKSEMLVRINPWNKNSIEETNAVIAAGADIVMLPYYKTPHEVEQFIRTVDGRCKTTLLLETKEAEACLDDTLSIPGIDEMHIGLNDLHLSYGLDFMFELLSNGTVERICKKISKKGIPYGFGGIAKIGDGAVPAEKIILEHYRLGSSRAILSRTFCDNAKIDSIEEIDRVFEINMKKLRDFEEFAASASDELLENNRKDLRIAVSGVVNTIRSEKETD